MDTQLTTVNTGEYDTLLPLRSGKPVTLSVKVKGPKKKRIGDSAMLFLLPLPTEEPTLALGMQGYGCEVMKVSDIKLTWLMRAGLDAQAATVLRKAIQSIYEVDNNG